VSDSNFSVNADAMTPAVDGLAQLGDRLGQITQHLESRLDGLGTPWGDDKNGHNFFQQYGKSRDQTLSGMSSMVDAVHGVSKGIDTMIKGYHNINDSAKERARNLQSANEGGGGGGGNGGGGGDSYTRDQTPLQPERAFLRDRMPAKQLEPERAFMRDEMPAEPLQRGELREGKLLPEEPLRPTLMSRDAAEPLSPLLAEDGTPVGPVDRGVMPRDYVAAEEGTPAHPLLARETVMGKLLPAERNVPAGEFIRDEAPSTEGRVTSPEYGALEPGVRGEYVRDDAPSYEGTPLQPTHYDSVRPAIPAEHVRMDAMRPVEPLQPAHFTDVRPTIPAEHVRMAAEPLMPTEHARMDVMRPVEPLQPAHFTSVRPTIPAEQPVAFERVHDAMPLERPVAFERAQESIPAEPFVRDSIPAEPVGFAELEPERRIDRLEPEIPEH
jgi:hypothetical protein